MTTSWSRPQSTAVKTAETVPTHPIHQDIDSLRHQSAGLWQPASDYEESLRVAAELNPYHFDPDVELVSAPQAKPFDPSLGFSWLGTLVAIVLGVVAVGGLIVFSIDRVRSVPGDNSTEQADQAVRTPDIVGAKTQ